MNVEHFGKSKEVNKDALRVAATVEHGPGPVSSETGDSSAAERIIGASDQYSKEELVSAMNMMMERVGMPVSALEELADNEEGKDRMNVLATEYLQAVKTLDIKKQNVIAEEVKRIFG